ncbi:MAG: alpha/beta hydrolase [Rhodospirillales bacterium]|jgi:esterase|nr:alpha/beta hydrolase [Rhodospirillales bacterium]
MTNGYEIIGNGPSKVLVLHGWLGDERIFEPLRPSLSTDEFTYCCPAYRGFGKSRGIAGRYTMDEIADDAIAVADALGWRRFAVVGHSMGGMAVQNILRKAPDRVRGLVAVTPVPASGVPLEGEALALFEGAAANIGNREAIIDFSTGNRHGRSWIRWMAQLSWESADPAAFAAYLTAWTRTDISAAIKGMPTKVLAIVGENDSSLTAEVMKATYLASYPNASLEVLANCGHYPMDEVPVCLATVIERFLRDLA